MKDPRFIAILLTFWALLGWTLFEEKRRKRLLSRRWPQWALDCFGLTMHGTIVPVFQTVVLFGALSWIAPYERGALSLPASVAFLLSFVGIDYGYYWNHRLLHTPTLWRFHAVHHSGESFDVFTTSRNSAITTFLILYIWVNGVLLFLLRDPVPYAWGVALSNILDIIRHAGIDVWPDFPPFNWIISPRDHAWHHSADRYGINFGANLNLWDRLHGTYHKSETLPERIGAPEAPSLWSAFWKGAQGPP